MSFHREVFKGQNYGDVFAQARAYLIENKQFDLAAKILELDPTKEQGPFTSGFTELVFGTLEPWPYNDGHTHYLRVKWNG